MTKKISALFCIVVLCLTMVSFASADNDASTYSATACEHQYEDTALSSYIGYTKVSNSIHRRENRQKTYCVKCGQTSFRVVSYFNENHVLIEDGDEHSGTKHLLFYSCKYCYIRTYVVIPCSGPPCVTHM